MVAIRKQPSPTIGTLAPSTNRTQTTPAPKSAVLPRSNGKLGGDAPPLEAPKTLWGRVTRFFKDHDRAVATVLLGASVLPAMTGCATSAMAMRTDTTATPQTPEQKFAAFEAKIAELDAKKGEMSYTDLVKARQQIYKDYVAGGGTIGVDTDVDNDGLNLAKEMLFGTSDAKIDSDGDKMSDAYEVSKGFDPSDAQLSAKADVEGWLHGYIPMSGNPMIEGNGLLFYDMLMKDRTGKDPAMRHIEGRSAYNGGHYFLSSTLSEKDAEMTTGYDFNGDGVLTPGVEWDFLKPGVGDARFGKDGNTDTTLSVGWWGHCNDVATAGIQFNEPKHPVTFKLNQSFERMTVSTTKGTFHAEKVTPGATHTDIKLLSGQTVRLANADITSTKTDTFDEVTFSPTQIKELLSEMVHRGTTQGTEFIGSRFYGREGSIKLNDGSTVTGGITSSLDDRADVTGGAQAVAKNFTKDVTARVFNFESGKFETKTFKAEDIKEIRTENKRDVAPVTFHETMLKWIGSDGKAGVMDKDSGPHVWNYSFDRYEMTATESDNDADTMNYEMKVYFVGNSYPTTYNYSISYEDGVPTGGKWDTSSPNPDFFWKHNGDHTGYDHSAGSKATPIKYDVVMELYKKSTAETPPEAPVTEAPAPVVTD